MNICSLFQKLWVFADDLMCVLQIGASVARVDQLEAFTELFYFAEIIFGRLHPLLYSSHHSGTTAVVWALWEITMDIHGLVGCRWFLAAFGEGYLDDLRQTTEEIKGFFKEADMDGSGLNQSCCASPQDSSGKFCGSKINSSYQDPRGLWVFTSGPFGYLFSAAPKSDGFHWARNIELRWISTPHANPAVKARWVLSKRSCN